MTMMMIKLRLWTLDTFDAAQLRTAFFVQLRKPLYEPPMYNLFGDEKPRVLDSRIALLEQRIADLEKKGNALSALFSALYSKAAKMSALLGEPWQEGQAENNCPEKPCATDPH